VVIAPRVDVVVGDDGDAEEELEAGSAPEVEVAVVDGDDAEIELDAGATVLLDLTVDTLLVLLALVLVFTALV
jgi:hypothetical protein